LYPLQISYKIVALSYKTGFPIKKYKNRSEPDSVSTMRQFLVAITKEDDFFIARCPELNVTSQGETLEEAEEKY
jgi:hypothetical protein